MPEQPFLLSFNRFHIAFLATALAALASTAVGLFAQKKIEELLLLGGLGALFVLTGTLGSDWRQRFTSPRVVYLYFAFQVLLANAIIIIGREQSLVALILFPLATHGVMMLSSRGAYLLGALLVVTALVSFGALESGRLIDTVVGGLALAAGVVFSMVFTKVAVRENIARAEVERLNLELATANRKLREYAAQVQDLAVANERNRLAREIHDSLGHYLTVINVQLEAASRVFERDPQKAVVFVRKAQSLAQEGLTDIRRSVADLRSAPLDSQPLPKAIEDLVAELQASGMVAQFRVEGDLPDLSPQVELTLYRAAQEALNNVRKHAHASRADVTLTVLPGRLRIVVSDNGVGSKWTEGGFGLLGVRERVKLLGGTFAAQSISNGGFEFVVEVPR
ncbi:MAG: sensor histidine kinase [Chloroflexi bacterium]|nr:sensor histidine kinase [Chloroflexota bacterium]